MDNQSLLIKRISLLQKVSLGIIGIYFGAKYVLHLNGNYQTGIIILLLLTVAYRSYLQYKLTGNKTKVILLAIAFLIAVLFGVYSYFNS